MRCIISTLICWNSPHTSMMYMHKQFSSLASVRYVSVTHTHTHTYIYIYIYIYCKNFVWRTHSLKEEQRFAILVTELWIVKYFWFTHLMGCRKARDCSYCHRISRNIGLAAAIVVVEESRDLSFWSGRRK